jgi:hypothetical protein
LDTFKSAGFIIAAEKSDARGSSSQGKEYLGFTIDTALFTVEGPENKLNRIKKILSEFLLSSRHKVRVIASVLGKLISLEPALGKSILVGTRLASIAVVAATEVSDESQRRRSPWESWITLDSETMEAMSAVRS